MDEILSYINGSVFRLKMAIHNRNM